MGISEVFENNGPKGISTVFHKTVIEFKENRKISNKGEYCKKLCISTEFFKESFSSSERLVQLEQETVDISIVFNRPFAYYIIQKPSMILINGHFKGFPDMKSDLNKFSLELYQVSDESRSPRMRE